MVQITRKQEDKNKSLLQKQFDAFLDLLLELELLVKQKAWANDAEYNTPAKYVGFVQEKIKDFLSESAIEASNAMISPGIYNEARYIMVSLADELFLGFDWSGKKNWEENILESQIFHSHRAGQEIFTRIDEMLESRDTSRYDLAYLYFFALSFGFVGKYKGRKSDHIKNYLENLYVVMHGGEPSIYNNEKKKIFNQAYEYTVADYVPRKLVDYRPWYVVFGLVFLFFVIASSLVWRNNTRSTMAIVDEIIEIGTVDKGGELDA